MVLSLVDQPPSPVFPYPDGIVSDSPGLRCHRYPGIPTSMAFNPEGVVSSVWTQPLQG